MHLTKRRPWSTGLFQKHFQDGDAAREHLENLLWRYGPVCPHCGVIDEATKLTPKEGTKTHGHKGLYQCNGCREQFTVTIGTIFEDSHIPLHKWLLAFHLMCSSKKGISALYTAALGRRAGSMLPCVLSVHPLLLGSANAALQFP